ncbi:hypothetical protein ABZ172_18165 [Streptomyces sp. NPDC006296]|uniref:hypothetical protein n=1 Tax=Streptomyces sp. NPDC006296 TaxID=3156746 RepID=UPI0033B977D2
MPTTLAQNLYMLCYTVKKEKFQLDNIQGRGRLLRAGAITESARDVLLDATGERFDGSPTVRNKEDRRTHKSALEAQAARFDAFVPGLRKALRDSCLARRAVGGGWSA